MKGSRSENRCNTRYWSGFSGLEEREENYSRIEFQLSRDGGKEPTTLAVSQKGFANEAARDHTYSSWGVVLQKIKELVEK